MSFYVLFGYLFLLWRNIYLDLLPIFWFFFSILSWVSSLYILKINPLSVGSFAHIFSHSEGCIFVLFMVSIAAQQLLSLIRSHLFIFLFIFITVGGGSKEILLWFLSEGLLPMFFCKSFIVSDLAFRYLIYFEYFCVCVWSWRMF